MDMQPKQNTPSTVDEIFAPLNNKLAARKALADLQRLEQIAARYAALSNRTDLTPIRIEQIQIALQEQYRNYTGVYMEQRHTYRSILKEVAETGSQTVTDILKTLRRAYINGLSLDSELEESSSD
jgi:hypothetical protein